MAVTIRQPSAPPIPWYQSSTLWGNLAMALGAGALQFLGTIPATAAYVGYITTALNLFNRFRTSSPIVGSPIAKG